MTMLQLPNATLERIVDIDPFRLPLSFLFPKASLERIEPHRAVLDPDHVDFGSGEVLIGVHSLLLRTGGLNILIDTCVGEHKPRPRRPDWHERADTGYLERLAAAGVRPHEVDIVLCTHLHADHAGWQTRLDNGRWAPTFPNARYLVGRAELDHVQALEAASPGAYSHGIYGDSMLPVIEAGLVETVEDGFEFAPGLRIETLPGHTPGQIGTCLDCASRGRAWFCGDAVHSPVQVFEPEWTSAFCEDPAQAVATRLSLFERVADGPDMLVPAHLRNAWGMRIRRGKSGLEPEFVTA